MSSLMHHGVKGQRWGVRRFQNKDGTLTAAGRKRKQHLIEVGSGKRKRLVEAAKPIGTSGDYSRDVTGLNRRGIHGQVVNEDDNTHIIKKGTSIYRTAANSELNDDGTYGSLTKNDVDRYIDYGRSGELPGADKSNLYSMKIFEFSANRDLKIANGKYITEIITDDVKRKMKNGDDDQVKLGKEILKSFKRYEEDLNLSFSSSEMRRSKEAYSRTEKEKEFDRDLVGKASDRLALYDKTILDYASGKDYRVIRDRLKREGYDGFIDVEDVTTIENLVRGGANTEYPVVILNANDVLTLKQSVKESETQRRLKRGTKFNSSRGELTDVIQHTSIGGTMYIEGNALILGDSSYLEHHGILGQKWGVRRFQNKDGTRTAAGKKRDAENLRSSQEAKNVNSKIHSYINKQLSSEDLDTGKSNYDFASNLIKDPDFEKVIMPVVKDIRQTKAKYGNKEPYEFTGDEHQAYMNDIDRLDKKTGELAITIGLAEKGEPHKKSIPPEGEYERVDMFRYALARYLDEHSPDGYSDEGDWIYHSSMEGTLFIEDGTLYLSHHGIRGQKWGVRRFQNQDGSLTNAGRKRLGYATKGAAQTVGKAFKAGVKAGGNAVKAVKAHHEKKEAEKLQKKKEKASKTRLGVMANKDLFTNEEIRKLNERFKLEDEMKMATLQKGVEIAKAVGTIAQNVGYVAKAYEDVTGTSLSPIKRKAAEEKARQDKEDRERRIAREDADEARKAAKEERDIAIHEQTLRKAIASADAQEFTAQKTKAEADSLILDLYKKGQDFNGGSDATGQSWVEKAKNGGKNPFDDMIANRDPEYAQIRKEHDEKVARKERIAELERREKEREAEKAAASRPQQPQKKQSNDDALFSQKGSLPIDKDRYKNSRAIEKAKHAKEDAAEERAKKQDEKAAKATIDDMMEARRKFTESARANSNGAFDRETAANYIKGKAKELPSKLNPINAIAKKITNKALKEEEDNARKTLEDEYKKTSRSQGRDEANYTMYYNRVNALQAQGYSERQAKKVADTESPFSSKRNRRFEYNEKIGEIETTHRKNAKEINKANKELTDYYYKLVNGPGYEPGSPKREALDRKYAQKRGELERLEKDNNDMLEKEKKKAKKILEHSFSIQNGVLFIDSSDSLAHHGVKGQRWGVRRFQNEDGSLTEKGRKHYEKAIEKLDRKQVNSDNRRGRLERQHPFAVTASAILTGSAYAALMVASAANPAMIVAGSAIAAAVSALGTHVDYSIAEAWEGRGTKRRQKKRKEYEEMLNHDGLMVLDGTLYLEHHGIRGQKWGVRRFQNPDGTRTEAGKKHDAKLAAKAEKKAAKIATKDAKRSAKAEQIRAKAVERYERKAALSTRESEAEAYKLVARDTKKASQKELLSDQKVSTTIAVGQGILGAIGLATYGVPTVAAIAGGAAIVGIMRNYNLETVRTNKTLKNLKGAEKARLAKSRATDQIMDDWREEGLGVRHYELQNGTLFINAGEPYLEHHGVKGMKWGKHLMAGKGVDAEGGGGGGFAEDDEKLKEMAKKAGMSVAEFRTKMAGKLGGAASKVGEKISVKDKHLVINGSRSGSRGLAVGETGEKPKSFKEKAYNALGGKYKTQAAEAHREMVQKRNDADDKARRANAQGRAANANKKTGNVREYMANKEGARQLDAEAKYARTSQWEATKKANRAQWKYDHSIAGLYDKATGKYKQAHKKTAIPKTIDRWKYEYTDGPNSKLFNNGKGKAKAAKEQAKAEVWNAADHQIKAKEYNDVANSQGGNANYYGQAYKNAAEREARLAEGSYRRAAALGKQAASEDSISSRPRARKKRVTSGGSGVSVRKPGRKPVSRTKRVTKSSTGVKRRSATGTGARVRRGA